MPIGTDWRSGFYLVTLTAHGAPVGSGRRLRLLRRPRRRDPRAACLLVVATNTYNAYNSWGGRACTPAACGSRSRRPFGRGMLMRPETERDDRKARPATGARSPTSTATIYQEYRFANGYPGSWARRVGSPTSVGSSSGPKATASSSTTPCRPISKATRAIVDGYDLVLGVGHDEYWSAGAARHGRGNTCAAAATTPACRATRCSGRCASSRRTGDAMVCHKYTAHETDPVVGTGAGDDERRCGATRWSAAPRRRSSAPARPTACTAASARRRRAGSGAFTVYRNDHWLLAGTGLRYGDLLGADDGVVGYETVGCRLALRRPPAARCRRWRRHAPDVEVVAFTPSSNLAMGEYPASIAALDDQGDLEFIATRLYGRVDDETACARVRHGNAVMLTCRPFGRRRRRGGHHRLDRLGVRSRRRPAGRPGDPQRDRARIGSMKRSLRWLTAATVVAIAGSGCGDQARDDARDSLVKQLEDRGLDQPTAECVVDAFFKGKSDQELKGFFDRPQLTPEEAEEFAVLGDQCR